VSAQALTVEGRSGALTRGNPLAPRNISSVRAGEVIGFDPGRVQCRSILSRKLNRVRIDAAHAMGVGKIEMCFGPFPPFAFAWP